MSSSANNRRQGKRPLETGNTPINSGPHLPSIDGLTRLYEYGHVTQTQSPVNRDSATEHDRQTINQGNSDSNEINCSNRQTSIDVDNESNSSVIVIEDDESEDESENEIEFGRFTTNIVGLRYYHGMVGRNQSVVLERQPDNPYDTNAIRAMNIAGEQIGHIPKGHAAAFAPMIDRKCIRLEGVCPLGTVGSTYQARLDVIIYGPSDLKTDVLEALRRFAINLTRPRMGDNTAERLVEGSRVTRLSSQQIMTELASSVKDLAKLPVHPSPPGPQEGSLKVQLLHYQLQGLAWMVQAEHPRLAAPSTKKLDKHHTQFWATRKEKDSIIYCNVATNSLQRETPALMRGGILADDMGLGKTLQTIALLLTDPSGYPIITPNKDTMDRNTGTSKDYCNTTLVVCPLSVIGNWETQLTTMAADADSSPLFSIPWLRVVLDEGHLIKNPKTQMSLAACRIKAERRWIISGTPVTNDLNDLYSLIKFLNYKPFDNMEWYNMVFKRPIRRGDAQGLDRLKVLMQSLCIRRTKAMKLQGRPLIQMPPCNVYLHKVKWISDRERELYALVKQQNQRLFRHAMHDNELMNNYAELLEMLMRMRQLCDHPSLCPESYLERLRTAVANHELSIQNIPAAIHNEEAPINWDDPLVQRLVELLRDAIENGEDCCICLEALVQGCITPCAHFFCRMCIERVIATKPTCPMCRKRIKSNQLLELPPTPPLVENTQEIEEEEKGEKEKKEEHVSNTDRPTLEPSAKINALLTFLHATPVGIKSVVFSQWTSMLDKIEPHLESVGIPFVRFDGTMSRKKRDTIIERFSIPVDESNHKRHRSQSDIHDSHTDIPIVMLISLKCGALGLNLTAASQVFLLDPWWNASIQDQAIDRVYRLGQTRPVNVFQFVIEGSIEEKVMDIQAKKRALVAKAFSGIQHEGQPTEERRETRIADLQSIFNDL
ncbi:P-loop containing nucleoside triphosphate hydrolase protein [Syncephalis fuscata]|nr:P-loop containing nucleoside triphosphate hydrolase protein [Syncephalis fuscata]